MKKKRKVVRNRVKKRNPFVALALLRKAGTHRKSNKAKRRKDKMVSVAQW